MKRRLALLLPLLAFGCSSEPVDENKDGIADGIWIPETVLGIAPSTPKGTVSGQVLTTRLAPLEGATVAMTLGSLQVARKAAADAEGNFVFQDVPAGAEVLLTVSKPGFATLRATSVVPSEAGDTPINDGNASFGPITLAELNGALRFTVLTESGQPATGARATLEARPTGAIALGNANVVASAVSAVVVSAVADAQGVLAFTGVPTPAELDRIKEGSGAGTYRLWVEPLDANGDGLAEASGGAWTYAASEFLTNGAPRLLTLPPAQNSGTAFEVSAANLGSLRRTSAMDPLLNMRRPGEPIVLRFSHPLQGGSALALLTDEFGSQSLPLTADIGGEGRDLLTLTPGPGVIREGQEYNLLVRAVSAQSGAVYTSQGPARPSGAYLIGGDVHTPKGIAIEQVSFLDNGTGGFKNGMLDPGEKVCVHFNQVVALIETEPGRKVELFFNVDLDSDGEADVGGEDIGELNNTSGIGFALTKEPPTGPHSADSPAPPPVFPLPPAAAQTEYTTRHCFVFPSSTATTTYRSLLPGEVDVHVRFSLLPQRTLNMYETAWGQPITQDLQFQGATVIQPTRV